MTEKYILGQRALAKSKSKIGCLLNTWNYEKHGEPTPEKISKLIPMGIDTVKKHMVDFRSKINKINAAEQERLSQIEAKKQILKDAATKYKQGNSALIEKINEELNGDNL